jgi:hypothetical protein
MKRRCKMSLDYKHRMEFMKVGEKADADGPHLIDL